MKTWTYFWVSQLGTFAGTVAFVNVGTQIAKIDSLKSILSPGLIGSFLLLGLLPLVIKRVLDFFKSRKVYAQWQALRPARFDRNPVVVGAGAAGRELAMAAAHALRQSPNPTCSRVTLAKGGSKPAQGYPAKVQQRIVRALQRLQITVLQDACAGLHEGETELASVAKLACDVSLLAIGAQALFSVEGAWVWTLKDRIDRQFVKKYGGI